MRYELKFISYHFGNQDSFLLKRWTLITNLCDWRPNYIFWNSANI